MHPSRVLTFNPTPKIVRAWHQLDPLFPAPKCVHTSFILVFYVLCPLSSPVLLAGPHRQLTLLKHLRNTDSAAESISSLKTLFRRREETAAAVGNWLRDQPNPGKSQPWVRLPLPSSAAVATSAGGRLQWGLCCKNRLMHPKYLHTNKGEAIHCNFFIFVFPIFDLSSGMIVTLLSPQSLGLESL